MCRRSQCISKCCSLSYIPEFCCLFPVICILNQVEKLCQEFGVTFQSPDFVSKADNQLHSNSEVQVWPIQELLCVVLGRALKRTLCQQYENLASSHFHTSCKDIAKNLQSIMLPLPSIPPILVAMITLLTDSNELVPDSASDIVKTLIPKLMMMILKHSELSPSVKQMKDWLSWKQETSKVENGDNEMQMDWTESEANREVSPACLQIEGFWRYAHCWTAYTANLSCLLLHYDGMLCIIHDISSNSFYVETTDARNLYCYIVKLTSCW